HDITAIWMTSSLFNRMVDLDVQLFHSLRYLLVGGDVLSPVHINRVRKHSPHLTVINGYGPTENTTFSTTFRIDGDYDNSIPIGKPIANSTVYILDRAGLPVPVGVNGELVVGGDGVSRGYMNRPELTSEKFLGVRNPFFKKGFGRRRQYRTGDLARWLPDGNILFLGRIDRQVKIRGFRIELGEIQYRLLHHEDIENAAVIARRDGQGENYLCAYVIPVQGDVVGSVDVLGLRDYLSGQLPEYMIPAFFIPLDQLPLTPNGKLDMHALPAVDGTSGEDDYSAPDGEVEEKLAALFHEILGANADKAGRNTDYFKTGGHSLNAVLLISKIHQTFNVRLSLVQIFQFPTLAGISRSITEAVNAGHSAIQASEEREYYPLSPAQKRLFVLNRLETAGTDYNIPWTAILKGPVEKERLASTFGQLVQRHESLRTSFQMVHGEPVQKSHDHVTFEIERLGRGAPPWSPLDGNKAGNKGSHGGQPLQDFVRPFNLSHAPLMRVGLAKTGEGKHILMVDMHHIVSDGVSTSILVQEFMAFYQGGDLPPLNLQYKDYALWQNNRTQSPEVKAREGWWLNQMAGDIPMLELPVDFPRPAVKSTKGSQLDFELEPGVSSRLKQMAGETGATPFMVLLSVFNLLLFRLSNQEDIIVGTPTAGRSHSDLQTIIGVFINTLGLRNHPAPDKSFSEFLAQVKENSLQAFQNQDYQFEDLVDTVVTHRDLSRNALFDVMMTLQNMDNQKLEIPGLILTPYQYETVTSKFDLTLTAMEEGDRFLFSMTYSTALFKQGTVERFINYFKRLAHSLTEESHQLLSQVELLSDAEKQQLLIDFNDTEKEFPEDRTIDGWFESQVERTPDQIAVTGRDRGDVFLSYRGLSNASNQLAKVLKEKGLKPGGIAALMVDRSVGTV
ncbi:MAG: AMP-binding protein, partial [bacterium]|nr:AMP-binding protein [bacterium]